MTVANILCWKALAYAATGYLVLAVLVVLFLRRRMRRQWARQVLAARLEVERLRDRNARAARAIEQRNMLIDLLRSEKSDPPKGAA